MPFVLIDRTAGTNIGNMTGNGGLAAAFDGTTTQVLVSCAALGATSGYVGKTLASAKRFGRAIVYGSSGAGFKNSSNPSITLNIRGKSGTAPSSATDGTIVGTLTFTDTADESAGRTIESTDYVNSWDHLFVEITSGPGTETQGIAEVVLYEWLGGSWVAFF